MSGKWMKCIIQAAKLFAVIINYYQFTTSKREITTDNFNYDH